MNKKGMTLVELLVYMALAALVMTPIVMLMNKSSLNMAKDAGSVNLQMTGRELLSFMYDDIKNLGFKLNSNNFSYFRDYSEYLYTTSGGACGTAGKTVVWRRCCIQKKKTSSSCGIDDTSSTCGPVICNDMPSYVDFYFADKDDNTESKQDSTGIVNNVVNRVWDSSSFLPGNKRMGGGNSNNYYDTLTFVKMVLDAYGNPGVAATKIEYKVTANFSLKRKIKEMVNGATVESEAVLARNVAAFKLRYSDNLINWYDHFNITFPNSTQYPQRIAVADKPALLKKRLMQYVKVIIVLRDPKKLSPLKKQTITLIADGDVVTDTATNVKYYQGDPKVELIVGDQALYERHEIVIPIPNNGLFPPAR